jgi:UDP-glucose:(heptosyl)LPS alpha-1,3-glucosyltransferase
MKIAFVLHDYRRAGVGQIRYVWELARRLSREHEVHVFANYVERDDDDNIHFHHVPAWRANVLTAMLSFAVTSTLKIRGGFDVLHSQGFCGFYGNVFTAHICNRAWDSALRKLEGGVTFRESVFNALASALEHFTYRRAKGCAVIAVSEHVADDIRKWYHSPASMHVIYHGVNLETFSPAARSKFRTETRRQLGIGDSEFVFLYVGQLRKGAARCIQALAKLDFGRLICVSPSPSDSYRVLAEKLGVCERVQFISFTREVERFYGTADAFFLPTPYDSFGMVVTEAMACGLPVVVSRNAGASELIDNGRNGLIIEDVTNAGELADMMRRLAADPGRTEQIGQAGRRTVEDLTWDSVAQQTLQVYQQVLSKNAADSVKTKLPSTVPGAPGG